MPVTKKPPRQHVRSTQSEVNGHLSTLEVLTLVEAAAYLRVDVEVVLRLIEEQALPARQVDSEWRFLKSAIQRWLARESAHDTSKAAQLAVIGSWKDDLFVNEELQEIYQRRRASEEAS